MLALRDWQHQLQHAILASDASADLLQAVRRHGVIPQQRIGIYRDAYRLRLAEALASNYPAMALYLGETEFSVMAQAYTAAHPSCHASIRWFGDRLGAFLHSQAPWALNPLLQELARFEWALRHTVDAPDKPALTVDTLRELPAEGWPELSLTLQPAATILPLEWNAPGFWRCLVEQQALPALQSCPQHWLVYRRQDLMAMWRSVAADEAQLLLSIRNGITFADLCDLMAEHNAQPEAIPAQAALLLRQWVEASLLVDTTLEHNCPSSGI